MAFPHLGPKPFRREDLAESGWLRSFPVITGCGVSRPGQIRDKYWAGDPFFGGWILVIVGGLTATVLTADSPGDGRSRSRKETQEARKRLHEKTSAAADQIAAEAHAKLPRSKAQSIGAIYVRFSTFFQDSAVDQIRALYEFALENKIFIPREYVYFDLGVRGYTSKRDGLDQLRAVLAAKKVNVLLLFATNRLFRKLYLTLQFVEEVVAERGIRCVFVKSGIDTANKDQWQMLLHLRGIVDEFQI